MGRRKTRLVRVLEKKFATGLLEIFKDGSVAELLRSVLGPKRRDVVRGIEIDLRHELLDPTEWEPAAFGVATPVFLRKRKKPFIWFPWFGDFDMSALRRDVTNMLASKSKGQSSLEEKTEVFGSEIDQYVRANTPECIASAGDKIRIDSVRKVSIGDKFEHPHNAEIRYARLSIERPNGGVQILSTQVKFTGKHNIVNNSADDVIDRISEEICKHFAMKTLEDIMTVPNDRSFAYLAMLKARSLQRELAPIRV